VLKADAYGMGAVEVGRHLQSLGCDDFFVASAIEGAQLRECLTRLVRIHVFAGAIESTVDMLREHDLRPVLNTVGQLDVWRARGRGLPCNIHVDTGMARLGISWHEVERIDFLGLSVESVFTHMACADEPEHPFNAIQLDRFAAVVPHFPQASISLGNSPAILSGFHDRFDRPHLGRPGIALYGGNPFAKLANPMRTVALVEAQILQVRRVLEGESVGYGGTYSATKDSEIATLGIGYADGIPRSLSNIGYVADTGRRFPIVGRVSMDLLQADITDSGLREGDWLEVFGREIALDEMAASAGTLSYEILTRIGPRMERVYRS
jgi:alanine racemase